jgi:hypothetical protein
MRDKDCRIWNVRGVSRHEHSICTWPQELLRKQVSDLYASIQTSVFVFFHQTTWCSCVCAYVTLINLKRWTLGACYGRGILTTWNRTLNDWPPVCRWPEMTTVTTQQISAQQSSAKPFKEQRKDVSDAVYYKIVTIPCLSSTLTYL